jgi:hypothetical protein
MSRTLRTFALFASGFVVLSVSVLVVNQTAQVVQLAGNLHPALGRITLWALVIGYAGCLGVPVVLFLRLPAPLIPPESEEGPEFETHLDRLRERLARSPYVAGSDLSDRARVEEALGVLAERADAIVKETASGVFVATAVSQSGRLDALLVLAAQSRMVWRLAHLYHQRPTLRDMAYLYGNVAGTTFLAGELQDVDLRDQVEPVLSSAASALGASLPGFQWAGAILVNCVLSGSANAFLTLRVGMIAKRYCGSLVVTPRPALRRAATAEAAQLLGGIVADGSGRLSKAVWRASVDKVNGAVSNVSGYAKDAGAKLFAKVWQSRGKEPQPEIG